MLVCRTSSISSRHEDWLSHVMVSSFLLIIRGWRWSAAVHLLLPITVRIARMLVHLILMVLVAGRWWHLRERRRWKAHKRWRWNSNTTVSTTSLWAWWSLPHWRRGEHPTRGHLRAIVDKRLTTELGASRMHHLLGVAMVATRMIIVSLLLIDILIARCSIWRRHLLHILLRLMISSTHATIRRWDHTPIVAHHPIRCL